MISSLHVTNQLSTSNQNFSYKSLFYNSKISPDSGYWLSLYFKKE